MTCLLVLLPPPPLLFCLLLLLLPPSLRSFLPLLLLLLLQDGQDLVFTYHNMLKSEAAIMQAIRELGPFDGICGFSQVCFCVVLRIGM
jgi:hypothetical protein